MAHIVTADIVMAYTVVACIVMAYMVTQPWPESPLPVWLRRPGIRFISVAHEQGAAHMADGFSRVTGKHGVCIAQNGWP